MKSGISCFMIAASMTFGVHAFGADWKYYGGSSTREKEDIVLFYDSGSIKKSNRIIRVWTKAISVDVITNLTSEEFTFINEKASTKLKNGYVPPYLKVAKSKEVDDNITFAGLEQLANNTSRDFRSKVLQEINCSESKVKILSMSTSRDGALESITPKPTKWSYIEPESNLEVLEKILCRRK